MSTRVLLLPLDPAQPVRCLMVDADGAITQALHITAGDALPSPPAGSNPRTLLVVPGSEVGTWSTDLPARDPGQALAAARLLLADRAAEAIAGLHIAIGPLQPRQPRQLCWLKASVMGEWLERAAAIGVQPDVVIPDYLALPDPHEATLVAEHDGRWLARGPGLAFSAEPGLARQVLADRRFEWIDQEAVAASLAVGALQSHTNLLQYDFVPRRATDARGPSRRRLAWLAALVVASPLLLVLADALRYQLAANSLRTQAEAIAAPHLAPGTSGDPAIQLAATLAQREAPGRATALRAALFEAIAATPGTRLEALASDADATLQATLVHATPLQLQQLQDALATRHVRTTPAPSEAGTDGLRTRLQLEPSP